MAFLHLFGVAHLSTTHQGRRAILGDVLTITRTPARLVDQGRRSRITQRCVAAVARQDSFDPSIQRQPDQRRADPNGLAMLDSWALYRQSADATAAHCHLTREIGYDCMFTVI
jgi:hypothetical protein